MDKKDESPKSLSSPEAQVTLEMIYAVKTLAENLDVMHRDLRQVLEEDARARDREIDRIKEIVTDSAEVMKILPIQTADRLDRLIDRKVDGVLTDARQSLEQLRLKLSFYMSTREGQQGALSALTDKESSADITVVEPQIVVPIGPRRETVRTFLRRRVADKAWGVTRWVVAVTALIASGWVILDKLFSR